MPLFLSLFTSLKTYAYLGAGLALLFAGGYVTRQWDNSRLKSALAEQQTALIAQCDKDKAITTEASKSYEGKINALNSQLATLSLRPETCVPIVTSPPSGRNAAPTGSKHGGQNAVNSRVLIDYSAVAEKYRLQLAALQDFVNKVWANK